MGEAVKVFGKLHYQPRLVAMQGDPGISYEYSQQVIAAEPWTPTVLAIKREVERVTTGHVFNGCLLNRYNDGSHCMGAHRDNERSISGYVASVSFGAERDFVMRRMADREAGREASGARQRAQGRQHNAFSEADREAGSKPEGNAVLDERFVMRCKADNEAMVDKASKTSSDTAMQGAPEDGIDSAARKEAGKAKGETTPESMDKAAGKGAAGEQTRVHSRRGDAEEEEGDGDGQGAAGSSKLGPAKPLRKVLALQSGSLLVMTPRFQQNWTHELPRRASCRDTRINLTFREFL
eukprot:jgi/Mesvir1/14426/Mv09563-RA.1